MSVDVLSAVLNFSDAKGTDRNVLIAIADSADPKCGISWLSIDPPSYEKADPTKCIAHRARCSGREVKRAIKALEAAGELQVRKAQRGQRRINVYKVTVGLWAEVEVDYTDLPFVIKEPFTTCQIVTSYGNTGSADVTSRGDDPVTSQGDELAPHEVTSTRARRETSFEPAAEPKEKPQRGGSSSSPVRDGLERLSVPAAASAAEPVSLERAVASLASLTGWDSGSLGVVAPLLQQVPEVLFEEVLASTRAKRARNPVGMFVHLLSTSINDWRQAQHQQALDRWDAAFGEAGMERVKREDPERYVLAWAAPSLDAVRPLPPAAVVSHILEYLFAYVDDGAERLRLLEVFVRAAERQPAFGAIRDWILMAIDRHRFDYSDVTAAVETLVSDEQLKAQLLRFAEDVQANVDADEKRRREDAA